MTPDGHNGKYWLGSRACNKKSGRVGSSPAGHAVFVSFELSIHEAGMPQWAFRSKL